MSRTYEERLIAGLESQGWKRDSHERSKYAAFSNITNVGKKFFVGKAGALRYGRCASDSWSVGDPSRQTKIYLDFLSKGDAVLGPTRKQATANIFEQLRSQQ